MKQLTYFLAAVSFLFLFSFSCLAQEKEFSLTEGRVDEAYGQSITQILRDEYGLSIASGSQRAEPEWVAVGKLPPGLKLANDGMITGTPEAYKETPYRFRVKVIDTLTPDAEPLTIMLSLKVLPPRVKLVSSDAISVPSTQTPPTRTNRTTRARPKTTTRLVEAASPGSTGKTAKPVPSDTPEDQAEDPDKGKHLCSSENIVVRAAPALADEDWPATFEVKNAEIKKLNVFIQGPGSAPPVVTSLEVSDAQVSHRFVLSAGNNKVTVFGLDSDDTQIECTQLAVSVSATEYPATVTLGREFQYREDSSFDLSVMLTDPQKQVDQLKFVVRDPNNRPVDQGTRFVTPGNGMQKVLVKFVPGKNTINVFGLDPDGARITRTASIVIDCADRCAEGAPAPSPEAEAITINPTSFRVFDQPDTKINVKIDNAKVAASQQVPEANKRKVDRLYYKVTDNNQVVVDDGTIDVQRAEANEPVTNMNFVVSLAPSENGAATLNTITVIGLDDSRTNPAQITNTAISQVACLSCSGPSSRLTGDSLHTRAIVGFEQVGGSGATSTQKPFLDFFFSAPIGKKIDLLTPRFQFWGNARIASVTQQTNPGALGAFTTAGFLTNIQNTDVNKIAQGFDFLVGVEMRLVPRNEKGYFSLIPGTRQRSSLSFIASFGGITPLEVDRDIQPSAVFKIPQVNGKPDPAFIERFPEAFGKKNIAFVAPTRDRFFRQYYGGIRIKTLFFDKRDQPINRFPAIFDITFGQNELVTGYLRNVLRFEGFYPFPIRAASFFYLYGTATMKLGRRGGRVELPLFLQEETGVGVTSDTALVPIDRNPSLRSTRDNYRLGVGINLIELLNRLRDRPSPQ